MFTAADAGTRTFTGAIRLVTGGDQTVAVSAPHMVPVSATVTVTGQVTYLAFTAPAAVATGDTFDVTVTAVDAAGAVADGYSSAVHFTSSDGLAGLPPDYTFTPADAGSHTFTVTLNSSGREVGGTIGGGATIAVPPGAAQSFALAGGGGAIGVSRPVIVVAKDVYGNTATSYNGTIHVTSSDAAAVLPADAALVNGVATVNVTLLTLGTQNEPAALRPGGEPGSARPTPRPSRGSPAGRRPRAISQGMGPQTCPPALAVVYRAGIADLVRVTTVGPLRRAARRPEPMVLGQAVGRPGLATRTHWGQTRADSGPASPGQQTGSSLTHAVIPRTLADIRKPSGLNSNCPAATVNAGGLPTRGTQTRTSGRATTRPGHVKQANGSPDHSRRAAHRRAHGQRPCPPRTGAYDRARQRLPEGFFSAAACSVGRALGAFRPLPELPPGRGTADRSRLCRDRLDAITAHRVADRPDWSSRG